MRLAARMALLMPLLLLLALQPQASAQGRQAAAQTPAAQTPAAVPGGRGGRGGVPGPGPAIGGEVDETPVVTHHSITVQGKPINYTATVAQMPLKDAAGETEAHIFYMAYTLDGVTDTAKRPRHVLLQRRTRARRRCGCIWAEWGRAAPSCSRTAACRLRRTR